MPLLTVAARYCGPPGTANGGYVAGLLSSLASEIVSVRLRRPVPLEVPLRVEPREGGVLELLRGEEVLAIATPAALQLAVPGAPDYLAALEASRHYAGFSGHVFPGCFVCGPQRARGDGLRIFAGATGTAGQVAAPWRPDASLGADDGKVRAEFMWAALDCPGYFAAREDSVPMLLAEFTAHVDRRVHIEESCVLLGWRLAIDGRRHTVGTALFDEDGELCARAQAVWMQPRS